MDVKKIEGWLYSIRFTEIALGNDIRELKNLEEKLNEEPTISAVSYDKPAVQSSSDTSEQERWVIRRESIDQRESLRKRIKKREAKLKLFNEVMSTLPKTAWVIFKEKYCRRKDDKKPDIELAKQNAISRRTWFRVKKQMWDKFSARLESGTKT